MGVGTRSGALTAGIILIVIGALFFLQNIYGYSAWRLIARYWPVLLIFIGLRKLYLYFTWPDTASK